jgi:cytochrome c5
MKVLMLVTPGLVFLLFFGSLAVAGDPGKGQGIYMNFCAPCHAAGIAGAPKVGDKAAWAPRLKKGEKVLVEQAIKGFQGATGFMPARGGNSALSDAEVADAVAYMTVQSK